MDEQQFKQQLNKYLDGELTTDERRAFETFIESDSIAKIEFENEQKFDKLLRNHVVTEEAPYELREAIVDQLQQKSSWARFRSILLPKQALVGVFSLFLVGLLSIAVISQNRSFPIFTEAVATHVDFLQGSYEQEIITDDIDQALAWFNGKLDFAISRPHLASNRAQLTGARIIQVDGQKAAYFMYNVDGRSVSAFVLNMENTRMDRLSDSVIKDGDHSSVFARNIRGYENILCYHKDVRTGCLFVTDMPKDEFISLMG